VQIAKVLVATVTTKEEEFTSDHSDGLGVASLWLHTIHARLTQGKPHSHRQGMHTKTPDSKQRFGHEMKQNGNAATPDEDHESK
jgi:hypothetical protein